MLNLSSTPFDMFRHMAKLMRVAPKIAESAITQTRATQTYWDGVSRYVHAFMAPSFNALKAFISTERSKLPASSPLDNMRDYRDLLTLNARLGYQAAQGSLAAMNRYCHARLTEGVSAWVDMLCLEDGEDVAGFAQRQDRVLSAVVRDYPVAIEKVDAEYGFHFDMGGYVKAAETERFDLYQVLPLDKGIQPREDGKPIIIAPPYVLGANILAFLPGEHRSYVHCFADQGIPTYIRMVKDIDTNPAVQVMTGEDDALDTKFFCERLKARHGQAVTLNGFCQGGYHALVALLSGELDGLVDAFITCATPIDGTRSKSLTEYMLSLPPRFRDMSYSIKTLPNGNQVVDGRIMAWVYKLRRMGIESPIPAFHRDLALFDGQGNRPIKIRKTAAAINRWIMYDQKDLPVGITKMSFASYTTPITEDGTLPVKLFGRTLSFEHLKEMGIPWLICIADNDDLVDKEASLVPLRHIEAEVCVFPKGHAAIATSWSIPTSTCSLHARFCSPELPAHMYRGPVCFHLDLEKALPADQSPCDMTAPCESDSLARSEDEDTPAHPDGTNPDRCEQPPEFPSLPPKGIKRRVSRKGI